MGYILAVLRKREGRCILGIKCVVEELAVGIRTEDAI